MKSHEVTIKVGDEVEIEHRGYCYVGKVLSVNGYSNTEGVSNWYIEFQSGEHGYMYWKEAIDGGQLVSVNGNKIDKNPIRMENLKGT